MSPYLPMLAYCGAVALAVGLLYTFESRRWYWHALSLALAFAIGFAPTRAGSDNPVADLITGFPIIFLLFWGLGGLLLGTLPHRTKHA